MNIKNFLSKFDEYVPSKLALSFDNVGLLVGDELSNINGIYICLDINEEIIDYVIDRKINTIIAHHPIIFKPIKSITNVDSVGRKLMKCIKNNINVIAYHTNLDAVDSGMNDILVNILDFKCSHIDILNMNDIDSKSGIGRVLYLEEEENVVHIVEKVKSIFNLDKIRFVGTGNESIRTICVINGSGNSMVKDCFGKGIDLVITGDITYHTAFDALENGVSIIDMGHFNSENIIYMEAMKRFIKNYISGDIYIHYDTLLKDVYKFL